MAQISCIRGNFDDALDEINKSLNRNGSNMLGLHLKAVILRKLGRTDEALQVIGSTLRDEKFNFGALYEKYLHSGKPADKQAFIEIMRLDSHNYCELALDYLNAGMNRECIDILRTATEVCEQISPMVYYYMGYAGDDSAFAQGAAANPDYCFPESPRSDSLRCKKPLRSTRRMPRLLLSREPLV